MLRHYTLIIAAAVLLFCLSAKGAVLTVPTGYSTIQAAMDAAVDGDTVVILPGTYTGTGNVNLTYKGKAITVRSENPDDPNIVAATVIDGQAPIGAASHGFLFGAYTKKEGPSSVLSGLTILNFAGGVDSSDASPRIEKCIIRGDPPGNAGLAISVKGTGMPVFSECTVTGTQPGIQMYGGSAIFEKCRIMNNNQVGLYFDPSYGGLADCRDCIFIANKYPSSSLLGTVGVSVPAGTAHFTDCTFALGGSVYVAGTGTAVFDNCLLARAGSSSLTIMSNGGTTSLRYCGVSGGIAGIGPGGYSGTIGTVVWGEGNFDCGVEPGLNATFGIKSTSMCVNKGDPNRTGVGETDIFGKPRVRFGRIDVGAAEVSFGLELASPHAGDIMACGSTREVRWAGAAETVNVYYSSDGGTTWTTVATDQPNTGSYKWSVPRMASINNKIAIEGFDGAASDCLESGVFEIRPYMAGTPQNGPWKSIGGDCHRRGLSNFAGPVTGCVKWAFETMEPVNNSVAVGGDGTVYVACDSGIVYAVDQDGWMIWGIDLETEITSSPSIGGDGTLYMGCASGELIALLCYDGNIRWTSRTGGMITAAAAVDDYGRVFAASTDGTVYGIGADGSDLWQWRSPHAVAGASAIVASPTIGVDGSVIVADAYWPVLYGLNPDSGAVNWQTDFTLELGTVSRPVPFVYGRLMAAPAVGPDGTIYVTFDWLGKLCAVSQTGTRIWTANFTGSKASLLFKPYWGLPPTYYPSIISGSSWSEAVIGPDGTIYVSMDDPLIRAVEPNGAVKWVTRCGMQGGFKLAVGADGYIYACGDEGSMYVIEPDGTIATVFDGDGWMSYPVIAADGMVYISDSSGVIWAIGGDCDKAAFPDLRRMSDVVSPRGVNFIEYAAVLKDWMKTTWDYRGIYYSMPSDPRLQTGPHFLVTDVNRDAYVDMRDIAMIAEQWLEY